jgi:hypothetical protein
VGERLEAVSQDRLNDVASELGLHFQECCDFERAIRYLRLIAQRSASRHELLQAQEQLQQALALCSRLPASRRSQTELSLMEQMGLLYRLMGQLARSASEFENMYRQAIAVQDLSAQLDTVAARLVQYDEFFCNPLLDKQGGIVDIENYRDRFFRQTLCQVFDGDVMHQRKLVCMKKSRRYKKKQTDLCQCLPDQHTDSLQFC